MSDTATAALNTPAWAQPDVSVRGPWVARHRHGVRVVAADTPHVQPVDPALLGHRRLRSLGLRGGARTRIAPERWPAEPSAPSTVDSDAFEAALGCLCPASASDEVVAAIAQATLHAAATYQVDPFMLGALSFHQSRCEPRSSDSYGVGLTRINVGMHRSRIRTGAYHYGMPTTDGRYEPRQLMLHGADLSPRALSNVHTHMLLAAALLRVFTDQCPSIDAPFQSVAHRHPVSHFVYGDHVPSALPESLLLTARRRLLSYYEAQSIPACMGCERALALKRQLLRASTVVAAPPSVDAPASYPAPLAPFSSPLDGPPRIVIGVLGDEREHGARSHAGIDLMGNEGEPVRAVQSGTVVSAGVDLRGEGLIDLPPERAATVSPHRMGARGLFVRIEHDSGLTSVYAHLADYRVNVGDRVTRGQLIGRLGLTGVQTSDAHLHFGLFDGGVVLNPLDWLAPHVISTEYVARPAL